MEPYVSLDSTMSSHSRLGVYAIVAVAGLMGAASDAILNQWARTGRTSWLVAAYASWIIVATVVGLILRNGWFGFGAAIILFLLVNSGGALILDRVLFGGRLTPLGWVGVVLAVAAILCIELGRAHGDVPGNSASSTVTPTS